MKTTFLFQEFDARVRFRVRQLMSLLFAGNSNVILQKQRCFYLMANFLFA